MKAAQNTFCGAGVVILNEGFADAQFGEIPGVVCLHKEAARVAKYFRAQFADAGKGCLNALQ